MKDMTLQNHDLALRMAELARVIALRKVDDVLVDVGHGLRIPARAVHQNMALGTSAVLMTRPERVELIAAGDPGAVPMAIAKRVFQGERILFELSAPGGHLFQCSVPSMEKFRQMQPGDRVGARFEECRAIPASQT